MALTMAYNESQAPKEAQKGAQVSFYKTRSSFRRKLAEAKFMRAIALDNLWASEHVEWNGSYIMFGVRSFRPYRRVEMGDWEVKPSFKAKAMRFLRRNLIVNGRPFPNEWACGKETYCLHIPDYENILRNQAKEEGEWMWEQEEWLRKHLPEAWFEGY